MKVILYLAMSVNGMIAGEKDEAPWSDTIWESYLASVKTSGNIIVGHRTYEIMKRSGDLDSLAVKPLWVVVSSLPIVDPVATFVPSLAQAIDLVKSNGFAVALIGGGSKLATSALEANLVDEIQLDIEPILMAQGIPLLQAVALTSKLSLIETKQLGSHIIHLAYSVEKAKI